MRKRMTILTAAMVLVVTVTTAWLASGRRLGAKAFQGPVGMIPTKSGWMADPSVPHYQMTEIGRDANRAEMSGSNLHADFDFLADKVDPASLDALKAQFQDLAAQFKVQAPTPPDRVQHFAWTDQARDVATFLGWGAAVRGAVRQGDGWLLELNVEPRFEFEMETGGTICDRYFETYVVRDGFFEYQGGRAPEGVRHVIYANLRTYSFE